MSSPTAALSRRYVRLCSKLVTAALTESQPTWYPLESRRTGKKKSIVTGEVLLQFSLYDPVHSSATPQQVMQKLLGIAATSTDADVDIDPTLSRSSTMEPDEDDDVDLDAIDSEDTNRTETPEKRKRRLQLARLRKKAQQRAYELTGSSDLAGVLFVEISKVTDLPPERNMTRTTFDMDPFIITSLGKKTYKTKVIRHNLNPVYDEKLVFQVLKHEVKYSLHFTVMDRDKMSGNDYVGACDLPLDKVLALAPEPDQTTGLYPLRETVTASPESQEVKKSRFRLPLSRQSSSNSIKQTKTLHKSSSNTSLNGSTANGSSSGETLTHTTTADGTLAPPTSTPAPVPTSVPPTSAPQVTAGSGAGADASAQPDDPELKPFVLPLSLKNAEKWEAKSKPQVYLKAKYLPYRALRQQFWRAMLRAYDADDNGHLSKVELTTMLDTLGSTLHESTIDGLFKRFNLTPGEQDLSYDQAVICLEGLLQDFEERKGEWSFSTAIKDSAKDKLNIVTNAMNPSRPQPTRADSETFSTPVENKEDLANLPSPPPEGKTLAGSTGEMTDTNDLADEQGEEHVVEIRECPMCHQPRLKNRTDADIITHIATCASQDWRQVNNIVMAGFVTSSQAQRKWYSKVINKVGFGGYKLGANSANILVQDRMTGQINEERMSVYVRLGIRLLYKGLKSREMEKGRIRRLLRSLSVKQGLKYDDPASAAEIQGFVNFHQLDMTEVLLPTNQFKNFNEFFYRKLKPDARPCSAPDRPQIITSPADCRSVVFNKLAEAQSIWVKGREFTISRLFGNAYPELVDRYNGGAMGIFRLAPQDYHRFHIPVDGIMGEPKLIEGEYYTVNPMAIRSTLDVYGENIRVLVPIDSDQHGKVMVVCVGAMMVGSTVITRKTGERVARAEELGYFKFGGSTILLLFEPGRMKYDQDLVDNSNGALETLVSILMSLCLVSHEMLTGLAQIRVGESIGHTPEAQPHTPDRRKDDEDVTQAEREDAHRRIAGSLAPDANNNKLDPKNIK